MKLRSAALSWRKRSPFWDSHAAWSVEPGELPRYELPPNSGNVDSPVNDSTPLYFPYGGVELAHLKAADPLLGAFIDQHGPIERELQPDLFTALAQSLIAQQISNAAAVTVWRRLNERFGTLTPSGLMEADEAALQACGIPLRKAQWLRHLGTRIVEGALDFAALPGASDSAVIQTLTALPGVGVWTAEMLLIFALGRPDVVSWGDRGLRNGMMRLYGLETLNKAQFAHYRERYRPYGTVASFYLWALAEPPAQTVVSAYPAPITPASGM